MLEADRVADEAMKDSPEAVRGKDWFTVWCLIRNAFLMGRGYGRAEERKANNQGKE